MEFETNLEFKSNLQPVQGTYKDDPAFFTYIHDPEALKILKSKYHYYRYRLTPLQESELKYGLHCTYADPMDYPWGTISDGHGNQRVVCRCVNTGCRLFSECRPGFSGAELIDPKEAAIELDKIHYAEDHKRTSVAANTVIETVAVHNEIPAIKKQPSYPGTHDQEMPLDGDTDTEEAKPVGSIWPSAQTNVIGKREADQRFEKYLEQHEPNAYHRISIANFYTVYEELVTTGVAKKRDYLKLTSKEITDLLAYFRQSRYFRMQHRKDLPTLITILSCVSGFREELEKKAVDELHEMVPQTPSVPDGFREYVADTYGAQRADQLIRALSELIKYLNDAGEIDADDVLSLDDWSQIFTYLQSGDGKEDFDKHFAAQKMTIQNALRLLHRFLSLNVSTVDEKKPAPASVEQADGTFCSVNEHEDKTQNNTDNAKEVITEDLTDDTVEAPAEKSTSVQESNLTSIGDNASSTEPLRVSVNLSAATPGGATAILDIAPTFDQYYSEKVGSARAETRLATFEKVYSYLQNHGVAPQEDYSSITPDEATDLEDSLLNSSLMGESFSEEELLDAESVFRALRVYLKKRAQVAVSSGTDIVGKNATAQTTSDEKSVNGGNIEAGPIRGFATFAAVTQDTIIKLDPAEKALVNAGPGTGKTWTLIEKVIYMINDLEIDPEYILILCFSRAAVEVVKKRMQAAADEGRIGPSWTRVDVRTFDSYSTWLIAQIMEGDATLLPDGYTFVGQDYEARIKTATQIIRDNHGLLDYKHVIVDEVQDLVGSRANLVLNILATLPDNTGFTIVGDYCQALYDYLAEDGQMSSEQFYETIFKQYADAKYYALTENHRQDISYTQMLNPYRESILTGTATDRSNCISQLIPLINEFSENIKDVTDDDFQAFVRQGTVGVLTRTNAQALFISSLFKSAGIPHKLQRSVRNEGFGVWIAKVFQDYSDTSIDEDAFIKRFHALYPNVDAADYWQAIMSTQRDPGNHVDVEDILMGLYNNARDPLLYESDPGCKDPAITISNIHRAKGREYDSVVILNDLLDQQQKDDDILEHKVCYVALTRPRMHIQRVGMSNRYFAKIDDGRCYTTGQNRGKKKYLSRVELKGIDDLDEESFAVTKEQQNYIRKSVHVGDVLKFTKNENPDSFTDRPYYLSKEMDSENILGFASKNLRWSLRSIIKKMWDSYGDIQYQYYPDVLDDFTVDRKITCISPKIHDLKGATSFGSMYIWTGLSITGLAKNDYYFRLS